MPDRRVTRVAAYGLVLRDSSILLCRVSAQVPSCAGQWTLPGGGLDFAEHPERGVVREVREETGLDVRPLWIAAVDSNHLVRPAREVHGIRIIYRTEVVGGELRDERNGSTDRCAWWPRDEAIELPLVELAELGLRLAFGGP